VKALVLAIACGVPGIARAEMLIPDDPLPPPAEPATHDSSLGFRFGGGIITARDTELSFAGLSLDVEHRVYGGWRITGEYEYVFLGRSDDSDVMLASGNGHLLQLALRHRIVESRWLADRKVRFYIDGEAGGGMMLGSDTELGTVVLPHALVGVRAGYQIFKLRPDTRASAVWEPEVLFRALATREDEVTWMIGLGLNWGG